MESGAAENETSKAQETTETRATEKKTTKKKMKSRAARKKTSTSTKTWSQEMATLRSHGEKDSEVDPAVALEMKALRGIFDDFIITAKNHGTSEMESLGRKATAGFIEGKRPTEIRASLHIKDGNSSELEKK